MVMLREEPAITQRDSLVGELHYAVKRIPDSELKAVVGFVKRLAVDGCTNVGNRLVNHTRCLITGRGEAVLGLSWSFDGERFMSAEYVRKANGRWESANSPTGYSVVEKLESTYQQKLREIEAAVLCEV